MRAHKPDSENAVCPVCNHAGGRFLYRAYDQTHGLPGEFKVYLCRACGVLYLAPPLTPEQLSAYYPEQYLTHKPEGMVRSRLGRKIERWLQPLPTPAPPAPHAKCLEIGCGAGGYLNRLRVQGWETFGVEMDPQAAAWAREGGHTIYEERFEEVCLPDEHYDLIVMAHVLEHLPQAQQALEKVARLLKTGGRALIRTPAHDSLAARLFGSDWFPLETPRHVAIFRARSLRTLCEEVGLCVLRLSRRQDPRYLLSSLERRWLSLIQGRKPRQVECSGTRDILLGLPLARCVQWLGLGDEITVECTRRGD